MKDDIVDIEGLADILLCSKSMIEKTWAGYPHFFVGLGRTARGARFDVNDVISYLKGRDYADTGQSHKTLDGKYPEKRTPQKSKKRVPDKNGSKSMGKINMAGDDKSRGNRFNLLQGIN